MTDEQEQTETTTEEHSSNEDQTDHKAELVKVQAALRAANKESAERRKRLEELEKLEAERKQVEMTELDKATQRAQLAEAKAAEAEKRASEMLVRSAFVSVASKAGALHPEDVYLLADRSGVTVTEDGTVEGVDEAVQALVKSGRIPLGQRKAPELDGDKGGQDRTREEQLTSEEVTAAKKLGLTAEQYAKGKTALGAVVFEKAG